MWGPCDLAALSYGMLLRKCARHGASQTRENFSQAAAAARRGAPPTHTPLVLIGHAASLTPY